MTNGGHTHPRDGVSREHKNGTNKEGTATKKIRGNHKISRKETEDVEEQRCEGKHVIMKRRGNIVTHALSYL